MKFTKLLLLALLVPLVCGAQTQEEAQKAYQDKVAALPWQRGPGTGQISDKAALRLDQGTAMLDMQNSDKFLQINGNPPSATRNVLAQEGWFAAFQFEPVGYVKDDEKIDADALLKQIQEGNVQENEERKKQGYAELVADGWYVPPHYDPQTKRLEWALKLHSGGQTVLNYTVRLLGRTGVESAILVSSPSTLDKDITSFKKALEGFEFNSGERYSEFTQGDRVAEFGLAALVAGGAAAVATKAGFWKVLAGSLAAFWKVIAAFFVAGWAGIRKFFSRGKTQ